MEAADYWSTFIKWIHKKIIIKKNNKDKYWEAATGLITTQLRDDPTGTCTYTMENKVAAFNLFMSYTTTDTQIMIQ